MGKRKVLPVSRKDFSCSARYFVVVLVRVRQLAALFSLRPHSFLLRKKRMGAPGEEKKENPETGSANRAAIASEEASSIPFPPGRRKLHIRSLLLPSQIVTVSLGHNLAIWNFTTPHAILMMAGRQHFTDTVYRGENRQKKAPSMREPFEI